MDVQTVLGKIARMLRRWVVLFEREKQVVRCSGTGQESIQFISDPEPVLM